MGEIVIEQTMELKQRKKQLEQRIYELVEMFEGETGLFVHSITPKRVISPGSFQGQPEALLQEVVIDVLLEPYISSIPTEQVGGINQGGGVS